MHMELDDVLNTRMDEAACLKQEYVSGLRIPKIIEHP